MTNQEQLAIMKQGIGVWNIWRKQHPEIRANLSRANLGRAYLGTHFSGADLSGADLSGADLEGAYFSAANLEGATLSFADLSGFDFRRANLSRTILRSTKLRGVDLSGFDLSNADLSNADLSNATLTNINLRGANLNRANLYQADLFGAYLSWADLSDANLSGATLFGAYLREANLSRANLSGADARRANFYWPDIRALFIPHSGGGIYDKSISAPSGANLSGADLSGADLSGADLSGADLRETNLGWANLSGANLNGADLRGCYVYATSTWDVQLEETIQANLIITSPSNLKEPSITVDNLEVAQFIYLLLNNKKIRDIIDTITTKVVLILGRFTSERKVILDAIKDELRRHDYISVLFDFDLPNSRDTTETVSTLARLARFIIADLTDAKSIPQELALIVPDLPSVPVQPLLLSSQGEYGMFEHYTRYPWVLPIHQYTDLPSLLTSLKEEIIEPAEQKAKELKKH